MQLYWKKKTSRDKEFTDYLAARVGFMMKREAILIFAVALATLVSGSPLDPQEDADADDVIGGGMKLGQRNWKECAWNRINNRNNNGLIKECSFVKSSEDSYLYVQVQTALRIRTCFKCCKRWYITFDGEECKPVPIDGIVYMSNGKVQNTHRPGVISGHCKVSKADTVKVALNLGNCYRYKDAADAYTGYNSATRIYLEEMQPPQ